MKLEKSDVFLACVVAISLHGCVDSTLNHIFKTYPKAVCVEAKK